MDPSSLPAGDSKDGDDEEDDEMGLQLGSATYELPPPRPLDSTQTDAFLRATMLRFVASGSSLSSSDTSADGRHLAALARGPAPSEMWVLLLIRMVTRGQRDTAGSSPERAKNEKMEEDGGALYLSASSADIKGKGRSQDEVWARNDLLRGIILNYVLENLPGRCVWCLQTFLTSTF